MPTLMTSVDIHLADEDSVRPIVKASFSAKPTASSVFQGEFLLTPANGLQLDDVEYIAVTSRISGAKIQIGAGSAIAFDGFFVLKASVASIVLSTTDLAGVPIRYVALANSCVTV